MRTYPRDSTHAAARIVALALVADGRIKEIELVSLDKMDAYDRLGISSAEMQGVLRELCADLLQAATVAGRDDCKVSPDNLRCLLAEVDDPKLRRLVFELCNGVARSDRMMHDGELALLLGAIDQWRVGGADPHVAAPTWPARRNDDAQERRHPGYRAAPIRAAAARTV